MPFKRTKAELHLSQEDRDFLEKINQSRTEEVRRVERARMLLLYVEDISVLKIADRLNTNPQKVYRCIDKRSEEHTSELQSRFDLVCRLLLEKKIDIFILVSFSYSKSSY